MNVSNCFSLYAKLPRLKSFAIAYSQERALTFINAFTQPENLLFVEIVLLTLLSVSVLTSIMNINNSRLIKVNPNPVHHGMILEFSLNGIYQLNIEFLDLNRMAIKRWSSQKTGTTLYLSAFPNSIYIAKIHSDNGRINESLKLIKE